ncbi:MAG: hypothetical protein JWP01_2369 [Myxococcales bacterium]|nr:hypothetical protein [Myxococcales bacterium]
MEHRDVPGIEPVVALVQAAISTVNSCEPSSIASSTPVIVTCWNVANVAGENVIVAGLIVPSPGSELESTHVTSADGATSYPTSSPRSSRLVNPTSTGSSPAYAASVLDAAPSTMSSTPVTVTAHPKGAAEVALFELPVDEERRIHPGGGRERTQERGELLDVGVAFTRKLGIGQGLSPTLVVLQ